MELVPHVYTSPLLRSIILGWFKPFLKFENHAMVSESQNSSEIHSYSHSCHDSHFLQSSHVASRESKSTQGVSPCLQTSENLGVQNNVTSVDNIYHATPVSMLIMNDTELNQTSLSLNACDLCVLCLSTFSRSNSRLQLLPSPFDKSFQLSHCFQHSTEPCILSPKHLRQSMATTCYKTYRIFAASGRDVNCCSLHWCHITTVQFCHLRKGWHHLSCKMLYIGNMPCQNCVTLVDPCCEHFQLRGEV